MTTLTLRCALRARPYPCRLSREDGSAAGMLLRVKDTTGLIADGFIARWIGPDALAFCQQHSTELIAGRCLDLQLTRLRAIGNELRADVQQCGLAPSWQGKPTNETISHPTKATQ